MEPATASMKTTAAVEAAATESSEARARRYPSWVRNENRFLSIPLRDRCRGHNCVLQHSESRGPSYGRLYWSDGNSDRIRVRTRRTHIRTRRTEPDIPTTENRNPSRTGYRKSGRPE